MVPEKVKEEALVAQEALVTEKVVVKVLVAEEVVVAKRASSVAKPESEPSIGIVSIGSELV